jgi:hypothetical protein
MSNVEAVIRDVDNVYREQHDYAAVVSPWFIVRVNNKYNSSQNFPNWGFCRKSATNRASRCVLLNSASRLNRWEHPFVDQTTN